ncbi:MAG: Ribosomal protein [Thermoleophilia bacterium]|nr:Ribosomal protein [Thermoleophilia bacterium]
MKTREFEELKKKDIDELTKLVDEKRTEILNLRFSHATGALEDPSRLGTAKRDLARVLTLVGQKRSAASNPGTTAATSEATA